MFFGIFVVELVDFEIADLVTMSTCIPERKNSIISCFDANSETRFSICFNMDKIINLGIPHVAELVFESIDTPGLIKCLEVSETWKVLAENVLIKRWKGKMYKHVEMEKQKLYNYFWNIAILKKVD